MILSIKSWGTKKKLHKTVTQIYWPELKTARFHVYIHVYQIIKIEDLVRIILYVPVIIENIFGVSLKPRMLESLNTKPKGTSLTSLVREVGKIWRYFRWEKGNFILIYEFKYGHTWNIWPSPLSLSLYSTFKNKNLRYAVYPVDLIYSDWC